MRSNILMFLTPTGPLGHTAKSRSEEQKQHQSVASRSRADNTLHLLFAGELGGLYCLTRLAAVIVLIHRPYGLLVANISSQRC